jgi:hypothetical protein
MKMKFFNFKIVLLAILCLLIFDVSAEAQKRRRTTAKRKPTAATRTAAAPSSAARSAAILAATEKVGNQIKNLSQFIFLLGNSTALISSVEADIKAGKASASARTQAEAGRKGFVSAITIFKNAMASLEDEFRASPALRLYLIHLVGVSDYAATAEQQAAAGQFDRAGRSLLLVVNQLTDVLREMP